MEALKIYIYIYILNQSVKYNINVTIQFVASTIYRYVCISYVEIYIK